MNKYALYTYNQALSLDKTIDFEMFIKESNYDEIMNYINKHFGDLSENSKVIQFPEVKKSIEIKFSEQDNEKSLEIEFFSKNSSYKFYEIITEKS